MTLEKGRTPSRENAKAWRDAATTYTVINVNNKSKHDLPTRSKPIMYLIVNKFNGSGGTPKLTYCAITTNDQSASVPFCPKRLNKISAMGWPIGLVRIFSVLVSIQKVRERLMASSQATVKGVLAGQYA